MKILKYILPAIFLLSSCGNDPAVTGDSKIALEWPGYIWFGTDINTRTTNVTSMNGKDFNVIAFKYGSDWNTFKATGTPASAAGTRGFVFPTTVSCASDGVCTYKSSDNTNPVEWDGNMKYSFFAYHPATSSGTVSLATTQSTSGVPAITYTVPDPESDGFMDAAKIPDIVIASALDVQNSGSGTVGLNFHHALCLFDVEARNLKKEDVTISNLILTITSKRYGNITIPLDGSAATPGGLVQNNFNCRMQPVSGTGSSVTVPEFGKDNTSSNTRVSYPDYNIAFIPQNPVVIGEDFEGSLSFAMDGVQISEPQVFTSSKKFEAGKKYSFVITIASDDSISITIIESDEWIDKPSTIIFE